MKAVLISIRPEWCEKIANKVKSLEIRKTVPKLKPPFKVYIYCTRGPPYLNSHNGNHNSFSLVWLWNRSSVPMAQILLKSVRETAKRKEKL